MQKKEKGKSSKDTSEKEGQKEGLFWNLYSISCIILAIILITFSCFVVNNYIENIKKHNVNYKWPKMSDLIPSIYILPLIMAFKTVIEYFSKGIVEFCLAKKYRQPKD